MAKKDPKKNKLKKEEKIPKNTMDKKKKEVGFMETIGLAKLDFLAQLRLVITMIFIFSTLSIILVFITPIFAIPVILILISYALVCFLMLRLYVVKGL